VIHLIFGKDNFRARRRLNEIRQSMVDDSLAGDMFESNTSVLEGRTLQPGELVSHATAVPFLGSARLVIVEGLVAHLASERRGRAKKGDDDPLAPWRAAAAQLGDASVVPPTTTLIFFEGHLAKNTAAYGMISKIAKVEEFDLLTGRDDKAELGDWVNALADEAGARLSGRAAVSLMQLSGGDLWAVKNEIDKLVAYTGGGEVDTDAIDEAGSMAQETKVWNLTDAIVAGNERTALAALEQLLSDGEPVQLLQFMVVREYRQIAVVKDLNERGTRRDEMLRVAGIPPFRLEPLTRSASRYSWVTLHAAYARMLEADLSVKRGLTGDREALQLLVHDLCAMAPRPATSGYRR
jgi:DNA polymerase-3 subunit delta